MATVLAFASAHAPAEAQPAVGSYGIPVLVRDDRRVCVQRHIGILRPMKLIAEQHRIVAKVDELMAVCDQLEAQLTTTQTDSRRVLEAVLHEALAPAMEEAA